MRELPFSSEWFNSHEAKMSACAIVPPTCHMFKPESSAYRTYNNFLMSGYSTLLLSQTVTPLSRQLTVIMRTSRKDTMRKESEKWNIHHSHLSIVFSTTGSLGTVAGSFYK